MLNRSGKLSSLKTQLCPGWLTAAVCNMSAIILNSHLGFFVLLLVVFLFSFISTSQVIDREVWVLCTSEEIGWEDCVRNVEWVLLNVG